MFRTFTIAFLALILAGSASPATAQSPSLSFTLDFPGSMPDHYSIRIQADGKGQYESRSKLSSESDDEDSFKYDFALSPTTRQKMFALAAKAGYFRRDLDSHRKGMAFTGKKTLAYQDAQRSGEGSFNYSSDGAVQELTSMFQNLSMTLEYGHRLDYDHHYQKLALDEELKRLEQSAQTKSVIELATIEPMLQKIVDDSSVINVSRARAQRILQSATK